MGLQNKKYGINCKELNSEYFNITLENQEHMSRSQAKNMSSWTFLDIFP